jgi:hypothetical protein
VYSNLRPELLEYGNFARAELAKKTYESVNKAFHILGDARLLHSVRTSSPKDIVKDVVSYQRGLKKYEGRFLEPQKKIDAKVPQIAIADAPIIKA